VLSGLVETPTRLGCVVVDAVRIEPLGNDIEVEGRGPHRIEGKSVYARSRTFATESEGERTRT
jgi:hypothetical protein